MSAPAYGTPIEFKNSLNKWLSPSRTIEIADRLKGRETELKRLQHCFNTDGRHAMIYGPRGVGKTSLAQTAVREFLTDSPSKSVFVSCERNTKFSDIIDSIYRDVCRKHPMTSAHKKSISAGINLNVLSGQSTVENIIDFDFSEINVDQAARLFELIDQDDLIVIVDEFDLIQDHQEKEKIAIFTKAISDRKISCKFVLRGIGTSADELFNSHKSSFRYFDCIEIGPLKISDCLDIMTQASQKIGVSVSDNYKYRVAIISDGFPHYVHDFTMRMFSLAYQAENGVTITPEVANSALMDAVEAIDVTLRRPFEKATEKYNDYSYVLYAMADGHELFRKKSSDVYENYQRIMREKKLAALEKSKFRSAMNRLKHPSYGSILIGSRQGWYEFNDRVVRGYVRLRAVTDGVELRADDSSIPSTTRLVRL